MFDRSWGSVLIYTFLPRLSSFFQKNILFLKKTASQNIAKFLDFVLENYRNSSIFKHDSENMISVEILYRTIRIIDTDSNIADLIIYPRS